MSETPGFDAREGTGDAGSDPAVMGEVSFSEPDADGGAVADAAQAGEQQSAADPPAGDGTLR